MHEKTKSSSCLIWWISVLLLGAILWYGLYFLTSSTKASAIQNDIQTRTLAQLNAVAGLGKIEATADGRDISLRGMASSQSLIDQAEQIALNVLGVRTVSNNVQIVDEAVSDNSINMSESESDDTNEAPHLLAKVEPLPESFVPIEETDTEQTDDIVAEEVISQPSIEVAAAQAVISNLDLGNIAFLSNSATLTEDAQQSLNEIATKLGELTDFRIRIEGHTDNRGDPSYNQDLSTKRAESVKQYLIDQGVNSARLEAQGFGQDSPIASNDTRDGRSKNRRIEFKLIDGE